jgi:hypothetical protein
MARVHRQKGADNQVFTAEVAENAEVQIGSYGNIFCRTEDGSTDVLIFLCVPGGLCGEKAF